MDIILRILHNRKHDQGLEHIRKRKELAQGERDSEGGNAGKKYPNESLSRIMLEIATLP